MKALAPRSQHISGEGAFAVWERALNLEAEGVDIIHLEVGEPDFITPAHIRAAGIESIQAGRTQYGFATGERNLREAMAAYVTRSRGVPTVAERVLVTTGVKGALYVTILLLAGEGDEVLIPNPGYSSYREITRIAGATPVPYPLRGANGFQPDIAEIASLITSRTKCILLNSPANPSGTILSPAGLDAIAELATQHDLWIISDEVYSQLYFTPTAPESIYTRPGMPERTILMDGLSKAYAMTGWRIGFGVFPDELVRPAINHIMNTWSCLPLFVQDAGVVALNGPQQCVAEMRNAYHERRDVAIELLCTLPDIKVTVPEGGFYLMMDVSAIGEAEALAYRFLEAGVGLLPGRVFGSEGGNYLRMALTQPIDKLHEAIARMKSVL